MRSRGGSEEWQFAAHPAFALKLTGPGEPRMPRPTQLGLAWLRLSRAEQARRRRAFFAALLAPWTGRTTFHARGLGDADTARLTWLDGVEAAAPAAEPGGRRRPHRGGRTGRAPAVVSGPLTDDTLAALLASDARSIVVRRDGRPLLATRDGWLAAVVHLTDDEEQRARERLHRLEAERAAQTAGADRRGRALAYLACYYVLLALAALVGWFALRQLGDAFPNALAVALGIAVAITFFSLLSPLQRLMTHWYGPG